MTHSFSSSNQEVILADAHCHLIPKWVNDAKLERIVKDSHAAGVKIIINCAITADTYNFGLKSTEQPGVYLALGVEPTKVTDSLVTAYIEKLESNLNKIVAVGEIGLDYYWVKEAEKREIQKRYFEQLLNLAQKHEKPIVIHSRDAEQDCIEILETFSCKNVLMHCFAGTESQIKRITDNNWYITVPTSAIYRKNFMKNLHLTPITNLMLETDSPYHSLVKGQENTPASIAIFCKKAAKMLSVSFEDLALATTTNVKTFYKI